MNDNSPWRCPECGELESQCRCDDGMCWVCHCDPCQCCTDDDMPEDDCPWTCHVCGRRNLHDEDCTCDVEEYLRG